MGPLGEAGARWEGQALGTQRPLKDELQSVEVGREGEGQTPFLGGRKIRGWGLNPQGSQK